MISYSDLADRLLAAPKGKDGVLGETSYLALHDKTAKVSARYFKERLNKDFKATDPVGHALWRNSLLEYFDRFSKTMDFVLGHPAVQDMFVQRLQEPAFYQSHGFYRLLDEYALSHSLNFFGFRRFPDSNLRLSLEADPIGILRSSTKRMPDPFSGLTGEVEPEPRGKCPFASAEARIESPGLNKTDTAEAGRAHNFMIDHKAGNELVLWTACINRLLQECCQGLERALLYKQVRLTLCGCLGRDKAIALQLKEIAALRDIVSHIYRPNISRKRTASTEPDIHRDELSAHFPTSNFETIMTVAICLYADECHRTAQSGGRIDESEIFSSMLHRLGKEPYFRSIDYRGPMRCPFDLSFLKMAPRLTEAVMRAGIPDIPKGKKKSLLSFVWVLDQVRKFGNPANAFFRKRFIARIKEYTPERGSFISLMNGPALPKKLLTPTRHLMQRALSLARIK